MKLLFIIHSMNLGGTEKALLAILNELDLKKYHTTVLLLEKKGDLLDEIPREVNIIALENFKKIKPIIYHPPLFYAQKNLKKGKIKEALLTLLRYGKVKLTKSWHYNYIAALKRFPMNYEADIAVAFAGPSDFISYLTLNNVKADRKYQWIHFDVSKIVTDPRFGQKYYSRFNRFFCVSENAKLEFVKMFPKVADRTAVFENIVSETLLQKQAEEGNGFRDVFKGMRILTLGRLSKEKGQDMIPEVVARLKKEGIDFKWYLIGDGKLKPQLKQQIKSLGIEDYLILLGKQLNPYGWLKDCDIYVQTSLHEGYCITLKEAQVFNKPIVTTRFLSADNLVSHEENGLIVDVSKEGIYEGVKRLLLDKNLYNSFKMRENPINRKKHPVQALFNLEKK